MVNMIYIIFGGDLLLVHSIICDQDVREALVKAFALNETKGLRFKFYSDWDQFWESVTVSDMPFAMGKMVLCFDQEPDRPLSEGCLRIKLTKQMRHQSGEVYLYQPIEHLIAAISSEALPMDKPVVQANLQTQWLFAPRLGDQALKQIEAYILRRTGMLKQTVILNLSFWRLPTYICPENGQQSVSDYLLAYKDYKDVSPQVENWPLFITKYKHPMDLMWISEPALSFLEAFSRDSGAKELIVISSLLPAEAMKYLAIHAQQIAIVCENDSDEVYREPYKKWLTFYHPDIHFMEKGIGLLA